MLVCLTKIEKHCKIYLYNIAGSYGTINRNKVSEILDVLLESEEVDLIRLENLSIIKCIPKCKLHIGSMYIMNKCQQPVKYPFKMVMCQNVQE